MILNPHSPLSPDPMVQLEGLDWSEVPFGKVGDLLAVPEVRHAIACRRWSDFQALGGELHIHGEQDEAVFQRTVAHNVEGIGNSLASLPMLERSELIFRPVMALDRIYSYRDRKVLPGTSALLVGARTEYEVLMALGYGFALQDLSAVDLISYSPWIQTGDMHALPYPDSSFDVLLLGWVLAYSSKPERVARELIRVARPGAVISIGNDCYTPEALRRSAFHSDRRPQSMKDLLGIFLPHVGQVYFSHEPDYQGGDLEGFLGHLIATFEVKKP